MLVSLLLLLATASPAETEGQAPAGAPPADRGDAAAALAIPPLLVELVPAEVPAGTVFPAPEVTVVLAIDVSATGAVEDVRVEEGAGEPFDSAAVAAARRFRFQPARLVGGETVPVSITFRLRITAPPPEPPPAATPAPVRFAGRLLERGTRRPLAGVPVVAQGGSGPLARAVTDEAGRFVLEVPAASFRVVAVPPGHARLDAEVQARPGEERDESFWLEEEGGGFEAVVRASPAEREVTRQVLPAEEVARVAGTSGDTLKAVLNLPGAARDPFGSGLLVLRGSAPGDSRVFLGGQQIPLLYHFGGLRSTVNPRFLAAVEFVPGNFSVEYGRATGGIIDVKLRDPAADLFRGNVTASVYDAGFSLEGPLGGGWAGGAAFHRSWIDTILPAILPSDANVSFDTAPRYYDYQFLASEKALGGSLRLLFFGSLDRIVALFDRPQQDPKITGTLAARTMFHALQATLATPVAPRLRQETSLQLSLQQFETTIGPEFFFDLDVRQLSGRSTWTWDVRPSVSARAGLDVEVAPATIAANVPQVPKEGEPQPPVSTLPTTSARLSVTSFQPAAFADVRWEPRPGLSITPGLRLDHYGEIRRWTLDPRVAARLELSRATALKAGVGLFQQPPSPDESNDATGTRDLLAPRAVHVSAGVERRVGEVLDVDATGFWKRLDRLVVRNPEASFDEAAKPYVNTGTGRIYGLELLVRARVGERASGWLAYTYQRSLRRDRPGAAERRFDFDQPHLLTVVWNWAFARSWSAGARFRLASGNPDTPVHGSVLDAASGTYVPIYGAANVARLPAFGQLDLRVDRIWIYRTWKLTAFLDVQNVTNRGNAEGYTYSFDYSQRSVLTGLPVLPILGVEGAW